MPQSQRLARWAPWLATAVAALVSSKTLIAPLSRDDLLQRAMVLGGYPAERGPFDLYDLVRQSERARFVDLGILPWWTEETYRLRFFRPLASLVIFVEHRCTGSALVMHALSLAWWALGVFAATWLYRRTLGQHAAWIATAIFAFAPSRVPALALVAQSEVLMAMAFGIFALVVLAAPKELTWRRTILTSALFAACLGMGEYGLCFGGYAFAIALTERDTARRIRAAGAFVVPAILYGVTRAALGYTALGTGFYRDPLTAPGTFATRAPRAFLTLAVDVCGAVEANTWSTWALLGAGALVVIVLFFARDCPRWLLVGGFIALVPLLGAGPSERLVGPALPGVAAALAVVIERAITRRTIAAAVPALAVITGPIVHGTLESHRTSATELWYARTQAANTQLLVDHVRPGAVGVIGLASWETAFFPGVAPGAARMPWRVLVTARHALMLRRDARTIDVVVPKGQGFFPAGADDLFRSGDHALQTGDERDVPGMHVIVLDANGAPSIRFVFERSIDDESFVWLSQRRQGYDAITPPLERYGLQLSP